MAGLFGNAAQATVLGMPDQTGLGVLGAGIHDAMAYFSNHPEAAGSLFPAMQQAQQMRYMQGILAPNPGPVDPSTGLPVRPTLNGAQMPASTGALNVAGGPPPPTRQQAQSTPDYGDLNPQAQAIYSQIPHIPGMPARQALTFYLTDPTAYQAAAVKQFDLTDLQKNTGAAYGAGTPEANAMMRGTLAKGAAVNLRPGGGALNYADGSIITMPGQNGVQTLFPQGMNGQAVQQMAPGAAQAQALAAYSQNAGKAATTPDIGYDATGNPIATNNLAMTGAGNPLGLPGQPAGAPLLPTLGARGLPRMGQAPQAQGASMLPALPANQAPYMAGLGKEAADRHSMNVQAAEGSPDRVNVLDNIINLSGNGVATGPGQDFQNKLLGYTANLPGLSSMMSGAKDNVAKFQELQKFLQQNGQRAWQAAGGTGTDAQLEAASHANPNDAQFPQALQTVAKWVKAGELAVQAKANAQDRYLQQNGSTPTNQNAFENQWRNSMDRRVFQLQAASPQEQQQMIKALTPQQAQIVRQKRQALMGLGAIQ